MARRKSEKQQDIERRYKTARKNLLKSISRYRKLGYDVSNIEVPKIPKNIKEGSIRNIKSIKPSELVEYGGKKGLSARREYQKEHPKQRKEPPKQPQPAQFPEKQEDIPSLGQSIYANLLKMINEYGFIKQAKKYVMKVLDDAIGTYGWEDTMRHLWNTRPEVVERARLFLKNSEAWYEEITTHFWFELVNGGELPTAEQAREEGEAEDIQYTDEASPWDRDNEDEEE